MATLLLAGLMTGIIVPSNPQTASAAQNTNTTTVAPNADVTTTGWTKSGCATTFAACVSDAPDLSGTSFFYGPNVTNTNNTIVLDMADMPADFKSVAGATVDVTAKLNSAGATGGTDTQTFAASFSTSATGAASTTPTAQVSTTSWVDYLFNVDAFGQNDKATWDGARIKLASTYAAVGATDTTSYLSISGVTSTITYITTTGLLTQRKFIFENDDGSTADTNSQMAAGDTALTNVTKGQRITTRLQVSGASNSTTADFGLFYDRNDGIWSRVSSTAAPVTAAGNCDTDTKFSCGIIDSLGATALNESSMAVDSTGHAWVAYYDPDNKDLKVATYVGTGGSCAGSSGAWNCTTVLSSGDTGRAPRLVIDASDTVWVAFYDTFSGLVKVADNKQGLGCAVSSWSCANLGTASISSTQPLIGGAIGPTGVPSFAYVDAATHKLYYASYVGAGGDCSSPSFDGCVNFIDNTYVDQVNVAFDSSGKPLVVAPTTANNIEVAKFNAVSGGGTGCSNLSTWSCSSVWNGSARFPSIGVAGDNTWWIAFEELTGNTMKLTHYVGGSSGGSAGGCGTSTDTAYVCSTLDNAASNVGYESDMAVDPAGNPWISYYDATNGNLKLARYMGSGLTGSGCNASVGTTWSCSTVEATNNVGNYASIGFAADGTAWIASEDNTNDDLRFAQLQRGGELTIGAGKAGQSTSTISQSHADMTSTTDSTNRNDADCVTGTWSNGQWVTSETAHVTIASGSCTELAYVIDTNQATASGVYRLMLATSDTTNPGKQRWRGLTVVSTAYPKLTMASSTTLRGSKDVNATPAVCATTAYGCETVDTATTTNLYQMAMAPDGSPWVVYSNSASSTHVWVAHYVGTGGSGCGGSTTKWICTLIDGNNGTGTNPAIAFDSSGNPSITCYNNTAPYGLKFAHYVGGTSQSSCGAGGSTAWTCTTLKTGLNTGYTSAIQYTRDGSPIVAYLEGTTGDLAVATYNSGGPTAGYACANSAWRCTYIDNSHSINDKLSMALDDQGNPWMAYYDSTGADLRVARFVGVGGTGCSFADTYICAAIDSTGDVGKSASIGINASNTAYISYYDTTNKTLKVATLASLSGTTCSDGGWTCTMVDGGGTNGKGNYTSLAIDSQGYPWVAYYNATTWNLLMARYVGGSLGGATCTGSSAWSCTSVDTGVGGVNVSMAFDRSGNNWMVDTWVSSAMRVEKSLYPPIPLSRTNNMAYPGRNAAVSDFRYRLDSGKSPQSESGSCSSNTDNKGYCAIGTVNDGNYDAVTANAGQAAMYAFSLRSASNATAPSQQAVAQSSVALSSTQFLKMQIYRFGSTLANTGWQDVTSLTSGAANTPLSMSGGTTGGTAGEYWQSDGSNYWAYYRIVLAGNASVSTTLKLDYFGATLPDIAPTTPSAGSLVQSDTSGSLAVGTWTSDTSMTFSTPASDTDNPDTLYLCVEVKTVATAFTNSPTVCGSGVAYAGSAVTVSASYTTPTNNTAYHWQARLVDAAGLTSGWVSFGGNSDTVTAANDYGLDTTAPTAGTVYDGTTVGTDVNYNTGSLTTLSANWTGFADTGGSGLQQYCYQIGTTVGGTNTKALTCTGTTASMTDTTLTLRSNVRYYVRVTAYDYAGNTIYADSDGQFVAPSLTLGITPAILSFGPLNAGSSYQGTASATLTVSTNAYNGYTIGQYATANLTSPNSSVSPYAGTWATPTAWSTATGFGYTSSDTSVQGSNRFATGTLYAGVPVGSGSAQVIADASASTTSTPYTISYKVKVGSTQAAGKYLTNLVYSATASF